MSKKTLAAALTVLDALDLAFAIPVLVRKHKWSIEFCLEAIAEYKKYLHMCLVHPGVPLVPSTIVDAVWHEHITNTLWYEQDCNAIFGAKLHHFPYFGMRGEQDLKNLQSAWKQTLTTYKKTFGNKPPSDIWDASTRCPNCGRRALPDDSFANNARPSLADVLKAA